MDIPQLARLTGLDPRKLRYSLERPGLPGVSPPPSTHGKKRPLSREQITLIGLGSFMSVHGVGRDLILAILSVVRSNTTAFGFPLANLRRRVATSSRPRRWAFPRWLTAVNGRLLSFHNDTDAAPQASAWYDLKNGRPSDSPDEVLTVLSFDLWQMADMIEVS